MPLPPISRTGGDRLCDMRGSLDAAAQAADLDNWRLEARVYMGEVVSESLEKPANHLQQSAVGRRRNMPIQEIGRAHV